MGIPRSREARLFYRCAFQRFEEAEVLFGADYTTGAMYLAGYGVECILKALVLSIVSSRARMELVRSFRGSRAHEFEWLRTLYLSHHGPRFPRELTRQFVLVDEWSTDIRYSPRFVRPEEAAAFLKAASAIMQWADGRL